MQLFMADHTVKKPTWISFNVIARVENFIFSNDFVILDCEVHIKMAIILVRPFMATSKVMVDIEKRKLKFRVNGKKATFNIQKSINQPNDMRVVSMIGCTNYPDGYSYGYLDQFWVIKISTSCSDVKSSAGWEATHYFSVHFCLFCICRSLAYNHIQNTICLLHS